MYLHADLPIKNILIMLINPSRKEKLDFKGKNLT